MSMVIKPVKRVLNPKKLLNSLWTAVTPTNKEKHAMVVKLVIPAFASAPVQTILLQALHSKRSQLIPWQQLNNETLWLQGWM
jgi:tryptophan-rich hypothetical protein